ncbi:MAG: translation initiation factor IF-2 [Flavobacteriales bacterium]|nr:translation initiation factor IF-2 [Flavobacteriales bacterium]
MSESKATRLGKAAYAFNVSKDTVVEFLAKKGIAIDNNPNAKIEAHVFDMLQAEFSTDKKAMEAAHAHNVRTRELRETITIAEAKKKKDEDDKEVEPEIDYSRFKRRIEVKTAPAPKVEPSQAVAPALVEPVAEIKPKSKTAAEKAQPADDEKPARKSTSKKAIEQEITVAPVEESVAKKKAKATTRDVKVVGKIDLEEAKPKTAGRKKKTETAAESVVELKPLAEVVPEPKPTAKLEPELIRVKVERLAGTKVMGKIELPAAPEARKSEAPKPGSADDKHKRKRKRVAKVDIQKQQEIERTQKRVAPITPLQKPGASEAQIQRDVRDTLARLGGHGKSKSSKFRKAKREAVAQRSEKEYLRQQEESAVLKLTEFVSVSELANMMDRQPVEIIQACMALGIFASINQRLDAETLSVIAGEFGYQIEFVTSEGVESFNEEPDRPEDMKPRPPVITVMGHVDHGKTSLLDFVRNASVVAGEAGGITQHIGAYNVQLANERKITFLDTPGHEAFTAMRARGAQVTDAAIIVVAADDSVMPQTREAISHAQAANVPMIFAINKIDKPDADSNRIREQLAQMNILVEEWGGTFQSQDISAKQGVNVDVLLEKVLLQADLLELKANPDKRAGGTVIESALDKGRGFITTVLVQGGTLRVGDPILAGMYSGRVKAMFNERGIKVEEAGPSIPVSLLGFEGAPNAGDKFHVMEDEREARNIANKRQQLQREQSVRVKKHLTIEEIGRRIALGEFKELNLIVKGDVDGSVEALTDSLQKLSTEKIQVRIIHKGVGQISESDILLASASDAILIGFQVRPSVTARKLAEKEEIQIKLYSVIYKAIEEVKEAMEGMLSAKIEEQIVATVEIREVFKISKVGTVAGCYVLDGKLTRQNKMRLIRDGIVIYSGHLGSLKRFKDDVKEVAKGFECGLNIDKFSDMQAGDIIESYVEVEVKQTL